MIENITSYWPVLAVVAGILVIVGIKKYRDDKDVKKLTKKPSTKTDTRALGHWKWFTPDDNKVHFTFNIETGGKVRYLVQGGPGGTWSMDKDNLVLHDVPDPAGTHVHADGSRRSRIVLQPQQVQNSTFTRMATVLRGRKVLMIR